MAEQAVSGRTVSAAIAPDLQELAQIAAADDATRLSAVVSSALRLDLGLSAAARRTARSVLASGMPEPQQTLLDECGRAIARAGDRMLREQLAERGRAMGMTQPFSEDAVAAEAVQAVREARREQRRVAAEAMPEP